MQTNFFCGNNNNNNNIEFPSSLKGIEQRDSEKAPLDEEHFSSLPPEKLLKKFEELGLWCPKTGLNEEKFSNIGLPELGDYSKDKLKEVLERTFEINFENIPDIITAPFSLIPEIVNDHLRKNNKLDSKIELIGSVICYILGVEKIKEALGSLGIEDPEHYIDDYINNKFEKYPNDIDLRIDCSGINNLKAVVSKVDELFQNQLSEGPHKNKKFIRDNAYSKRAHPQTKNLDLFALSYADLDNILIKKIQRTFLFSNSAWSLDISSSYLANSDFSSYPTRVTGKESNGWLALFSLLTRTLIVKDAKTVDHMGWIRLISELSRGYALWQESSEETLFETFTSYLKNKNVQVVSELFKLINKTIRDHHKENQISAYFLFLNGLSSLTDSYQEEEVNALLRLYIRENPFNPKKNDLAIRFIKEMQALLSKKVPAKVIKSVITLAAYPHFFRGLNEENKIEYTIRTHMGRPHLQFRLREDQGELHTLLLPIKIEEARKIVEDFSKNNKSVDLLPFYKILSTGAHFDSKSSRLQEWKEHSSNWTLQGEESPLPLFQFIALQQQLSMAIENRDKKTLAKLLLQFIQEEDCSEFTLPKEEMIENISFHLNLYSAPSNKEEAIKAFLKTGDSDLLLFVRKQKFENAETFKYLKQAIPSYGVKSAPQLLQWIQNCSDKVINQKKLIELLELLSENLGQIVNPCYQEGLLDLFKKVPVKCTSKKVRRGKKRKKEAQLSPFPYSAFTKFITSLIQKKLYMTSIEALLLIPKNTKEFKGKKLWEETFNGLFKDSNFNEKDSGKIAKFLNEGLFRRHSLTWNQLNEESFQNVVGFALILTETKEQEYQKVLGLIEKQVVVKGSENFPFFYESYATYLESIGDESQLDRISSKCSSLKGGQVERYIQTNPLKAIEIINNSEDLMEQGYLAILLEKGNFGWGLIDALFAPRYQNLHCHLSGSHENLSKIIQAINTLFQSNHPQKLGTQLAKKAFFLLDLFITCLKNDSEKGDPSNVCLVINYLLAQWDKENNFQPSKQDYHNVAQLFSLLSQEEVLVLLRTMHTHKLLENSHRILGSQFLNLYRIESLNKTFKKIIIGYLKNYIPKKEENSAYSDLCIDGCYQSFDTWISRLSNFLSQNVELLISDDKSKKVTRWIVSLAETGNFSKIEFIIEKFDRNPHLLASKVICTAVMEFYKHKQFVLMIKHFPKADFSKIGFKKDADFLIDGYLTQSSNSPCIDELKWCQEALMSLKEHNLLLWESYLRLVKESEITELFGITVKQYNLVLEEVDLDHTSPSTFNESYLLSLELLFSNKKTLVINCLSKLQDYNNVFIGENALNYKSRLLITLLEQFFYGEDFTDIEFDTVLEFMISEEYKSILEDKLFQKSLLELHAISHCFKRGVGNGLRTEWLGMWGEENKGYSLKYLKNSHDHLYAFEDILRTICKERVSIKANDLITILKIIQAVKVEEWSAPLFYSSLIKEKNQSENFSQQLQSLVKDDSDYLIKCLEYQAKNLGGDLGKYRDFVNSVYQISTALVTYFKDFEKLGQLVDSDIIWKNIGGKEKTEISRELFKRIEDSTPQINSPEHVGEVLNGLFQIIDFCRSQRDILFSNFESNGVKKFFRFLIERAYRMVLLGEVEITIHYIKEIISLMYKVGPPTDFSYPKLLEKAILQREDLEKSSEVDQCFFEVFPYFYNIILAPSLKDVKEPDPILSYSYQFLKIALLREDQKEHLKTVLESFFKSQLPLHHQESYSSHIARCLELLSQVKEEKQGKMLFDLLLSSLDVTPIEEVPSKEGLIKGGEKIEIFLSLLEKSRKKLNNNNNEVFEAIGDISSLPPVYYFLFARKIFELIGDNTVDETKEQYLAYYDRVTEILKDPVLLEGVSKKNYFEVEVMILISMGAHVKVGKKFFAMGESEFPMAMTKTISAYLKRIDLFMDAKEKGEFLINLSTTNIAKMLEKADQFQVDSRLTKFLEGFLADSSK